MSRIDPPQAVAPESLVRRHETLGISIRGLSLFAFFFVLTAVVLHADLWVLLMYLSSRPRPWDQAVSIAVADTPPPSPPLQPTPVHMNLPFEDLVQLRDLEDDEFRRAGWRIDPTTGEAVIPERVLRTLVRGQSVRGVSAIFPPVMAPVRAGRAVPKARWGTFPPVKPPEKTTPDSTEIAPDDAGASAAPAARQKE